MRDKVKKHTTSDRKTASKVRSSATKTDGANIEQAGKRFLLRSKISWDSR
jgi:hypothetical protein